MPHDFQPDEIEVEICQGIEHTDAHVMWFMTSFSNIAISFGSEALTTTPKMMIGTLTSIILHK